MRTEIIRVDDKNDLKLLELIFEEEWSFQNLDKRTYVLTQEQIRKLKKAGIKFKKLAEYEPLQPSNGSRAKNR